MSGLDFAVTVSEYPETAATMFFYAVSYSIVPKVCQI